MTTYSQKYQALTRRQQILSDLLGNIVQGQTDLYHEFVNLSVDTDALFSNGFVSRTEAEQTTVNTQIASIATAVNTVPDVLMQEITQDVLDANILTAHLTPDRAQGMLRFLFSVAFVVGVGKNIALQTILPIRTR